MRVDRQAGRGAAGAFEDRVEPDRHLHARGDFGRVAQFGLRLEPFVGLVILSAFAAIAVSQPRPEEAIARVRPGHERAVESTVGDLLAGVGDQCLLQHADAGHDRLRVSGAHRPRDLAGRIAIAPAAPRHRDRVELRQQGRRTGVDTGGAHRLQHQIERFERVGRIFLAPHRDADPDQDRSAWRNIGHATCFPSSAARSRSAAFWILPFALRGRAAASITTSAGTL